MPGCTGRNTSAGISSHCAGKTNHARTPPYVLLEQPDRLRRGEVVGSDHIDRVTSVGAVCDGVDDHAGHIVDADVVARERALADQWNRATSGDRGAEQPHDVNLGE